MYVRYVYIDIPKKRKEKKKAYLQCMISQRYLGILKREFTALGRVI